MGLKYPAHSMARSAPLPGGQRIEIIPALQVTFAYHRGQDQMDWLAALKAATTRLPKQDARRVLTRLPYPDRPTLVPSPLDAVAARETIAVRAAVARTFFSVPVRDGVARSEFFDETGFKATLDGVRAGLDPLARNLAALSATVAGEARLKNAGRKRPDADLEDRLVPFACKPRPRVLLWEHGAYRQWVVLMLAELQARRVIELFRLPTLIDVVGVHEERRLADA